MEPTESSYEVRYFRLGERFPFRDLPIMPTVCLLVADRIDPPYEYAELVTDLISIGCGFFMTWGATASKFEDVLDETIVDLSIQRNDNTFAVTTAHQGEAAEDVAFFMLRAALPGEQSIRCCVGVADNLSSVRVDDLRSEIQKFVGN